MKRLLVLLLCVGVALPALAVQKPGQTPRFISTWAAVRDAAPGEHHTEKRDVYTILYKLSSAQPVSVSLDFASSTPDNERKIYQKAIEQAYKDWFHNAQEYIKKSGHKKDFTQVLARLKKPKVNFVSSPREADLEVHVVSWQDVQENCHGKELLLNSVSGCVIWEKSQAGTMFLPNLKDLYQALVKEDSRATKIKNIEVRALNKALVPHEIGHTLGLADQYEAAIQRTSHDIYRSTHVRKGMMNNNQFSCDDADGIVNLLDILYGVEPGRSQGWHSLCKDSPDVYVNGVALGTGPYVIKALDPFTFKVDTYQRNDLVHTQSFKLEQPTSLHPLTAVPDTTVLKADELGRPARTQGPKGEVIYYQYNYGLQLRLITQNNKALRLETKEDKSVSRGLLSFLTVHVHLHMMSLAAGETTTLLLSRADNGEMAAIYEEGIKEGEKLTIEMAFAPNGTVTQKQVTDNRPVLAPAPKPQAAPAPQSTKAAKGKKGRSKAKGKKGSSQKRAAKAPPSQPASLDERVTQQVDQQSAQQEIDTKAKLLEQWVRAQRSQSGGKQFAR